MVEMCVFVGIMLDGYDENALKEKVVVLRLDGSWKGRLELS